MKLKERKRRINIVMAQFCNIENLLKKQFPKLRPVDLEVLNANVTAEVWNAIEGNTHYRSPK